MIFDLEVIQARISIIEENLSRLNQTPGLQRYVQGGATVPNRTTTRVKCNTEIRKGGAEMHRVSLSVRSTRDQPRLFS